MKIVVLTTLALLVAGGFGYWYWTSDERVIRHMLTEIEQNSSKSATEPPVDSLLRAARIAGLFSDPCHFIVEKPMQERELTRSQIQERITFFRNAYKELILTSHDRIVNVAQSQASVVCTIRIKGIQGQTDFADVQEVVMNLAKKGGQWRIIAVRLVAVLEQ